jgi:hypothetical protein
MALDSYDCPLCNLNSDETFMHLFFHCPFAMSCWNVLGLAPFIQPELLQTLSVFKDVIHQSFFMEIIISMCWAIWSARNDSIFRGFQHSVSSAKATFRREMALVKLRARQNTNQCLIYG